MNWLSDKESTIAARSARTAGFFCLASAATIGTVAFIAFLAGWRVDALSFSQAFAWESLPGWLVVSAIIFFAAIASSIVGFAFSAIAGALILHYMTNGVE